MDLSWIQATEKPIYRDWDDFATATRASCYITESNVGSVHETVADEAVREILNVAQGIPAAHFAVSGWRLVPDLCPTSHERGGSPSLPAMIRQAFHRAAQLGSIIRYLEGISLVQDGLIRQGAARAVGLFLQQHRAALLALRGLSLLRVLAALPVLLVPARFVASLFGLTETTAADARPAACMPRGAQLLDTLCDAAMESSEALRPLAQQLFKHAAAPFLVALSEWLYKGVVSDAWAEFMVEARPELATGRTDAAWDRCFSLRADGIPRALRALAGPILDTGRSMWLLRQFAPRHYLLRRRMRVLHLSMHPVALEQQAAWTRHVAEWLQRQRQKHVQRSQRDGPRASDTPSVAEQVRRALRVLRKQELEDTDRRRREKRAMLAELKSAAESAAQRRRQEAEARRAQERAHLERLVASLRDEDEREAALKERLKEQMRQYYDQLMQEAERRADRMRWRTQRLQLSPQRNMILAADSKLTAALADHARDAVTENPSERAPAARMPLERPLASPLVTGSETPAHVEEAPAHVEEAPAHVEEAPAQRARSTSTPATAETAAPDPVMSDRAASPAEASPVTHMPAVGADQAVATPRATTPLPLTFVPSSDTTHEPVELEALEELAQPAPVEIEMPPLAVVLDECVLRAIQVQNDAANQAVVDLLLYQYDLKGHLRALRKYLLLHAGDYGEALCQELVATMDAGERPTAARAQDALAIALRASSNADDPYAARVSMVTVNDTDGATAGSLHSLFAGSGLLSHLRLRYDVPPPLDLVITPAALEQYNLLFHLLLQLRRAAAALADMWACFNSARTRDPHSHAVQLFRHEMQHYVGILQQWVVTQALDACWRRMEEALSQPVSAAAIRRTHTECLDAMLRRCLLHERGRPVMEALQRMLSIVIATREQLRGASVPLPAVAVERVMATRAMFARCGEFLFSILSKFGERTRELDIEALVLQINFNSWIGQEKRTEL